MTIEELNKAVLSGKIDSIIRVSEARQMKALSKIADKISAKGTVRLLLIAGPSSAGKTTTSKRLVTQLAVNGVESVSLSTDDYFVGDARNPRDENGELDYEHINCVDIQKLTGDIRSLIAGQSVKEHRFDFVRHEPYDTDNLISLPQNGIVILEGIHALNPLLVPGFDQETLYRVYVEPVGQPIVFAKTRLSPRSGRLLRRLVRDNRYRKMSPIETFKLWPKVLAGEKKWIEPFKQNAEDLFDSALDYELSVLKPYAEGLLILANSKLENNIEAKVLGDILAVVEPSDPAKVPGDSILRETIGGSLLDY